MPGEQPFPLARLFRRRFVPAFLGFTVLFLFLLGHVFAAKAVLGDLFVLATEMHPSVVAIASRVHLKMTG